MSIAVILFIYTSPDLTTQLLVKFSSQGRPLMENLVFQNGKAIIALQR